MDAVEFLKAERRMCNKYIDRNTDEHCPLERQDGCCCRTGVSAEERVSLVEAWAKANPDA